MHRKGGEDKTHPLLFQHELRLQRFDLFFGSFELCSQRRVLIAAITRNSTSAVISPKANRLCVICSGWMGSPK